MTQFDKYDLYAGKGSKRKARKIAFQTLLEKGLRNLYTIDVWSKKKDLVYSVMVYVDKETKEMIMSEIFSNGRKMKNRTFLETIIHRNDPRIPNEVRNWY